MHIARATGGTAIVNNIALIRPKRIGDDLWEVEIHPPPGGSLYCGDPPDFSETIMMMEVTVRTAEVARMAGVAPHLFGPGLSTLFRTLEYDQ